MLGGAHINEKAETALTGLFAAGEASGGVQGAGRMQGAAFLETQVFGTIAGKNAAALAHSSDLEEISKSQINDEEKRINSVNGTIKPADIVEKVHKTMWEQVGIVRNKKDLEKAISAFEQIKSELLPRIAGDNIFAALEATNLLLTGELVARAALAREESRGAHFRSDYPNGDDERWLKHVCLTRQNDKAIVSMVPVINRK
jgi:fumarate reductase (CoM/CoB) subunit A